MEGHPSTTAPLPFVPCAPSPDLEMEVHSPSLVLALYCRVQQTLSTWCQLYGTSRVTLLWLLRPTHVWRIWHPTVLYD